MKKFTALLLVSILLFLPFCALADTEALPEDPVSQDGQGVEVQQGVVVTIAEYLAMVQKIMELRQAVSYWRQVFMAEYGKRQEIEGKAQELQRINIMLRVYNVELKTRNDHLRKQVKELGGDPDTHD